jgi:hypothetical protein
MQQQSSKLVQDWGIVLWTLQVQLQNRNPIVLYSALKIIHALSTDRSFPDLTGVSRGRENA